MSSATKPRRRLTVGVDIGGSKVRAVLLDERRQEIGRIRLPSTGAHSSERRFSAPVADGREPAMP